jgi:NDP-sugar pyrophosphorylase family protein
VKLNGPDSAPASGPASGMRAVILAGGRGVRLQPFTVNFPKPLMPLGDTPVLEVLIRRLATFGITDVTLTLGHLAELVKAYFDQRRDILPSPPRYVVEDQPTGTAGSLAAVDGLTETFLAMNGDLLTDLDLHALVAHHRQERAALTIATQARQVKIDLGVLEFDSDCRITAYHEKPEQVHHVSMGVYVYEPTVLRFIRSGEHLDFPDLVIRLMEAGERVSAFLSDALWFDIGRPDDYARAQQMFDAAPQKFDYV